MTELISVLRMCLRSAERGLIRAEHVSDNAVVIDIGINPVVGAGGRVHMVGDVDHDPVAARVRAITPVPGGVGPVTDVWVLRNTVLAAWLLAGHRAGDTHLSLPDPTRTLLEA